MTFREKLELEKERKKAQIVKPPVVTPAKVFGWGITLYTGKVLYDWWKERKESQKLSRIEKNLGKKCKFHLDLYSDERDAKIVESVILRFNEVLSSKRPETVITDYEDYETYYNAAVNAIKRSSPSVNQDLDYMQTCIEFIRSLQQYE